MTPTWASPSAPPPWSTKPTVGRLEFDGFSCPVLDMEHSMRTNVSATDYAYKRNISRVCVSASEVKQNDCRAARTHSIPGGLKLAREDKNNEDKNNKDWTQTLRLCSGQAVKVRATKRACPPGRLRPVLLRLSCGQMRQLDLHRIGVDSHSSVEGAVQRSNEEQGECEKATQCGCHHDLRTNARQGKKVG